jgi:hypothetical protein
MASRLLVVQPTRPNVAISRAAVLADAVTALDPKARMAIQSVTALADSPEERLVLVIG